MQIASLLEKESRLKGTIAFPFQHNWKTRNLSITHTDIKIQDVTANN